MLNDYNHPCIVTWVPVNESWGVRSIRGNLQQQNYCRMLTYLLKAMDPVRLVSANDGWEQVSDTDICAPSRLRSFPANGEKYDDMENVLRRIGESRRLFAEGKQLSGTAGYLTEYGGIAFEGDGAEGLGVLRKSKG